MSRSDAPRSTPPEAPSPPLPAHPPHHVMTAAAGLTGAIAGAATGALAGPPGAIAGGIIGGAAGLLAGDTFDREEARHEQHEAELDEAIGVTGPDLGVEEERKSVPPDLEPSVEDWNR